MTYLRRLLILTLFAGIIGFSLFSGCATRNQVKAIVAESNAAMVSPALNIPNGEQGESWKQAVNKIDQLITANPDQPVLVNHLKVRQAMLLTVNRQDSLARARWNQIDGSVLTTERDTALFNTRQSLVWWYKRAPDAAPLDKKERQETKDHMARLQETINGIDSPEIRIYLGTIRAQMVLKRLTGSKINTPDKRLALVKGLSDGLANYTALFSETDSLWVQNNWKTDTIPEWMTITDIRHAAWLRKMIREFKKYAMDRDLDEVVWKPEWIARLNTGG